MDTLSRYSKAIAGFIAPGVIALPLAFLPDSDGGTSLTLYEAAATVALMFGTGYAVRRAPRNRP